MSLGEPDKREEVVARNPSWGRLIILNNVNNNDELVLSLSNGGSIKIPSATLQVLDSDNKVIELFTYYNINEG